MSIVQVAKLAGCSHTTVSRVINQQPGVSEAAAIRVQAAMRKLGYTPPAKRRGPQAKSRQAIRTGNVALLMFGTDVTPMTAPIAAATVHAVEQALGDHGFTMALGQVKDNTRIPSAVARGDIDGLILHGHAPSREMADKLRRFPGVWIMSARNRRGYWGDRVAPDNSAVGHMAAEYLIDRGHQRIAFLYVDAAHLGFQARADAFAETAKDAGVHAELIGDLDESAHDPTDFRLVRERINRLIDQFVALKDRPTGIFVPRGQTTLMVFEALRARGIEPGRSVTVIACDNDPTLAGLDPAIATIDVRPDCIGRLAVEQLCRRLSTNEFTARTCTLVEPSLVLPPDDPINGSSG